MKFAFSLQKAEDRRNILIYELPDQTFNYDNYSFSILHFVKLLILIQFKLSYFIDFKTLYFHNINISELWVRLSFDGVLNSKKYGIFYASE